MLRGLDNLMEAPQRIYLRYKISLNLRSGVKNQLPTKFPRARPNRVSNPKFKKGKVLIFQERSQLVESVVKSSMVRDVRGRIISLVLASGHKMRECPNLKSQDKGSVQAQASGCSDAPKKNRFSNLFSKGDQPTFPDVVPDMLKVLSWCICLTLSRCYFIICYTFSI